MKRYLLTELLLLFSVAALTALPVGHSPPSLALGGTSGILPVDITIEPEQGVIGDTFLLKINITAADQVSVLDYEPQFSADVDILEKSSGIGPGETYSIIAFATGNLVPCTVAITLLDATDGSTESLTVFCPAITIGSVLPPGADTSALKFERPPRSIRKSYRLFFKRCVQATAIIAAVIAVFLLLRKYLSRFARRIKQEILDPRTAYQKAMDRLGEIRTHDYPGNAQVKEYYCETLDTLRQYLADVSGIQLLSDTMDEALRGFKDLLVPAEFSEFKDLYFEAEMVKFARYYPETEKIGQYLGRIESWITAYHQRQQNKENQEHAVQQP